MNHQDIISQKIEFLNGNSQQDLSSEALKAIAENDELANEILFIEALWNAPELNTVDKPSAQMQARFYQMLSHAQSTKATTDESKATSRDPLLVRLGLFKPAFQMLLLMVVFGVGWSINSPSSAVKNEQTAALESRVDALNVMVALSMLNKDSAAERLAGIDYAKNVNLADEQLTESLLTLVNSDRSSAVRLSAVEALANKKDQRKIVNSIVESLSRQKNVFVQIALVELLQNSVALNAQQLDLIYSNKNLDSEVIQILKSKAVSRKNTI